MKTTGARALVECLKKEGVDTIFGYPGGAVLPIYDALIKSGIKHVLTRHEQGAAHAADGYARAKGRVGVCLATSGPGSTNLVTGIVSAYMDSVPMVIVTGQVPVSGLGSDSFQEADTTGITIPVTKHNYLVKEVKDLPRIVQEAFHIANTGRPGPVLIDVPKDVSTAVTDEKIPSQPHLPGYKPPFEGHYSQIKRAAKAIGHSKRPVLLAGGGIIRSGAYLELLALAERAGIPVAVTLMGVSAFPGTHRHYLGMVGMHGTHAANRAIMESDLVIAVGTRFAERSTGDTGGYAPGASVIHIDIDAAEIGKNIRVDTPIVGDARQILKAMTPLVPPAEDDSWLQQVAGWKRTITVPGNSPGLDPRFVIEEILRRAGKDAIVTSDVGQHQMWTAQSWTQGQPGSFITSGGLGAMGFGLPAAVGAKAACPDRTVVAIMGDGGFQMNMQELATTVSHGFPVKVMIMNNNCLGMVRQLQEFYFKKRFFAIEMEGIPDFLKIAEAYGIPGYRGETEDDVDRILEEVMSNDDAAVVEFKVCPDANVFPMVSPGDPLDRMIGIPE